jgi:transcriptional regulator with XRE-family HTH domain
MGTQEQSSFGGALRQALDAAEISQAKLARELRVDASQVNRWIHDKAFPQIDNLHRIEKLLGVDLSAAFNKHKPAYELFVSAPISGLADEDIPEHHNAVAKVVDAARPHVNGLTWPGERIETVSDRRYAAANLVTKQNMTDLYNCPAFLYLQFAEVIGPSSALVELGFALGRKMKVTVIFKKGLTSPYMLRGFGAVSAKLSFLPDAEVYEEESVESAAALIGNNGRELLGLT